MLEDAKTQELKRRRDSEGYDCLTYDELKYLLPHVALPYEQETIKNILIISSVRQGSCKDIDYYPVLKLNKGICG